MTVTLQDLCLHYGARPALVGVSHAFEGGQVTGLIGPNGSGKTTLVRLISGALSPTGGRVLMGGVQVTGIPARRRAQLVSTVPQRASLDFDFTVLDLVLMGRQPYLGRFERERERDLAQAREAMRLMGVADLERRNARLLSGGEWQRVVIARALCQDTPVLLMDEPVSSLDIRHQMEVLSVIRARSRREGTCVVLVLHDLNLAANYCDRLALLSEGRLLASGAPDAVLTERNLEAVYGIRARVGRDEEGRIGVRPVYL